MSSTVKIRSALLAKGTEISRRTVSRSLVDDFGLKAYKPACKPRLPQAMKNKRLAFAKKHATWTKQQWRKALFSDESTVQEFTIPRNVTSVDPSESDFMKNTRYKP